MGYEVEGRIHKTNDTQQVTERFRKREFVLELADNPQYPQYVLFQLTGNRCEALDGFEEGQEVRVEFSLRGREWKSPRGEIKYFNSLDVWKLEPRGSGADREIPDFGGGGDDPPPPGDDDLPF